MTTYSEREARKLGLDHGKAAGSWVVDGNSDAATLRAILEASDEGSFYDYADVSGPLSGEYADGYSLSQLSDDLGVDQESDGFSDLCDVFEAAFYEAYEDEAVRSARAMLPEEESR